MADFLNGVPPLAFSDVAPDTSSNDFLASYLGGYPPDVSSTLMQAGIAARRAPQQGVLSAPPQAAGNTGAVLGDTAAPDSMIQYNKSIAQGILGMPPDQLGNTFNQKDVAEAAAQKAKAERIQDAIGILQASRGQQTTNLPLLALAAGIGKPTRTGSISEAISNGLEGVIPAVQQQRQQNLDYAKMYGQLGIEASQADVDAAQEAYRNFQARVAAAGEAAGKAGQQQTFQNRNEMLANNAQLRALTQEDANAIRLQLGSNRNDITALNDVARQVAEKYHWDQQYALGVVKNAIGQQNADTGSRNATTHEDSTTATNLRNCQMLRQQNINTARSSGLDPTAADADFLKRNPRPAGPGDYHPPASKPSSPIQALGGPPPNASGNDDAVRRADAALGVTAAPTQKRLPIPPLGNGVAPTPPSGPPSQDLNPPLS